MAAAPERMCAACRQRRAKAELLRFVRSEDGRVMLDTAQRLPGRGVYLCDCDDCLKKAAKSRALERALKAKLTAELSEMRRSAETKGIHG